MMRGRRGWLLQACALLGSGAGASAGAQTPPAPPADPVRRGRPMRFPRDHGAHLGSRIEWWYATGWLRAAGAAADAVRGFQVTFFRAATGLAADLPGRLAPRQLLFAHAAVSVPGARRHVHADRVARWAGQDQPELQAWASTSDAQLRLAGWTFDRRDGPSGSLYRTRCEDEGLWLDLELQARQPPLLQGDQGFSRKGPQESQASHYTSETQVAVRGQVVVDGQALRGEGLAWIDHEWSDTLLHPEAVGWDWVGLNLDDGRALTAYQLRRADGSTLWAGGSLREPDGRSRNFLPEEVQFQPGRRWRSPLSQGSYPVEWQLRTPGGVWQVRSLMDEQELDSRRSTGTVYWEGLSACLDAQGRRIGMGYLEMTGYVGRLQL